MVIVAQAYQFILLDAKQWSQINVTSSWKVDRISRLKILLFFIYFYFFVANSSIFDGNLESFFN